MNLKIFDGDSTVGGNKIYAEGVFLDFGLNMNVYNQFFDSYLKPRVSTGIEDYVLTGLLPPLNIYRKDIVSDSMRKILVDLKVDAVLISHAHVDHAGMIPYLSSEIPIVVSQDTLKIFNYLQTVGNDAYISFGEREFVAREDGVVISTKKRKSDVIERIFIGAEEGQIGNVFYKMFPVDHSIPGSVGYLIKTSDASLFYTGDFNLHSRGREFTLKSFQAVSRYRPDFLIIEGTNIDYVHDGSTLSEDDLVNEFSQIIKKTKGVVVFDFTSKNVERMKTVFLASSETKRQPVVTAEIAFLLTSLGIDIGDLYVLNERRLTQEKWYEMIAPKGYLSYKDINANLNRFVICMGFYDIINLLDINTKYGSYVFTRSEPFNEDLTVDFHKLQNWIRYLDMEFHKGENLHVSGHATRKEIEQVVDIINPKHIVPVHTQNPDKFKEIFKDKVILDKSLFYEGMEI